MVWYLVKDEVNLWLTKYHAMKTYCWSWGIDPRVLKLDTRWSWVVIFAPRPLYPRLRALALPIGEEVEWAPELFPRRSSDEADRKADCSPPYNVSMYTAELYLHVPIHFMFWCLGTGETAFSSNRRVHLWWWMRTISVYPNSRMNGDENDHPTWIG